jgi:hypothetical protein
MGAQPGDNLEDCSFDLPEYVSLGLSAAECADGIANKFSEISQEFPPINIANLINRIQLELSNAVYQTIPYISRQLVEETI